MVQGMSKKLSCVLLTVTCVCTMASAQQQTWIAKMSAVQSGPNSETISWTTAVPSDSRVYYRPSGKVYVLASNPQLTTSHAIVLTGLTAGVSYQYYVSSTDSATLPVTSGSSNYFTLSAFSWSATPTTLGFPGSPIVNATS